MTKSQSAPTATVPGKKVCTICGRPRDPRYDPFCSKRCADVDLYRWLKGGYVIPGSQPAPEGEPDDD
jgi:hypothetical protein